VRRLQTSPITKRVRWCSFERLGLIDASVIVSAASLQIARGVRTLPDIVTLLATARRPSASGGARARTAASASSWRAGIAMLQ
jgi:hypothetical protein